MATLSAIGFTLATGVAVFSLSMVSFGAALRRQSPFIATRCEARPRTVVYNPDDTDVGSPQNRGHPMWGWLPWVMKLSYATMMNGVPGTGTRDGGLSGLMLKVNLDGIVLLRFHHLCLRVTAMAAFLYIVIVLPVFKTAQCSRIGGDYDSPECQQQNLTDYQRLTLANIPPLDEANTSHDTSWDVLASFFLPVNGGLLARLYGVVFVSWAVTLYAYSELEGEWQDVLALRRVYFLEADHWSDRNLELAETLLRDELEAREGPSSPSHKTNNFHDSLHLTNRDPWVPHPEQRDTVPNIELYSVLVGGLPSLPTEAYVEEEVEAVFSRKQSIDWQLAVTAAFFDHCVPNQPGFSSSVAAVTILPAASQITEAWNQWHKAAAMLRQLRFIRRQIAKVKASYGEDFDENHGHASNDRNDDSKKIGLGSSGASPAKEKKLPARVSGTGNAMGRKKGKKHYFGRSRKGQISSVYQESEEKTKYYREVLGTTDDLDVEKNILNALKLGPEQTAVYSREFAQGAASLAPYGWNEHIVRRASLLELLEMEKKAAHDVQLANDSLREAQERITKHSPDQNMSDNNLQILQKSSTGETASPSDKDDDSPTEVFEGRPPTLRDKATHLKSDSFNEGDRLPASQVRPNSLTTTVDFSSRNDVLEDTEVGELSPIHGTPYEVPDSSKRISFLSSFTPKLEIVDSLIDQSLHLVDQSVALVGQSTRHLGFVASEILLPERRASNGVTPGSVRRVQRGSITSVNLPSDLGLEAGLFSEQRKVTDGTTKDPKRSKSNDDLPDLSLLANPGIKTDEVSKSLDHRPRPPPPRRVRSCDGVDLLKGLTEVDDSDTELDLSSPKLDMEDTLDKLKGSVQTKTTSSVSSKDTTEDEAELREKQDYEDTEIWRPQLVDTNLPDIEQGDAASVVPPTSTNATRNSRKGIIWDKIASETDRRSKLRNRLISVRSSLSSTIPSDRDTQSTGATISPDLENQSPLQSAASPGPRRKLDYTIPTSVSESDFTAKHVNFRSDDGESRPGRPRPRMYSIQEMNDSQSSKLSMGGADASVSGDLMLWHPLELSKASFSSHLCADESVRLAFDFEEKAGLRHRQNTAALERLRKSADDKWSKVVEVMKETSRAGHRSNDKSNTIDDGSWSIHLPTLGILYESFLFSLKHIFKPVRWGLQSTSLVGHLASESHYAVVTFTSRQAALAARHCLADSRGFDRWITVNEMPSSPLADAPVCNMASGCRGCVRPVTLSVNDKQKMIRRVLTLMALGTIYFFYTFPLTRAQQVLSPDSLGMVIPDLDVWLKNSFLSYMFVGFIPALVWTAFFAICPPMFKMIANFGSNATSSVIAEGSALNYFWWFMVVSAFTGTSLQTAIIDGFDSGKISLGNQVQTVLATSAATIPAEVSATWLNWMIVRVTMVLPTQYLLQMNTFLFTWLGLKCCARAVRGGGSGGPVPYRIYVDSGVVMLCLFALGPASPLIAAASFAYFLFCVPMLRWTLIFVYKPKHDIGGKRFPFIFDMCVSGMIVGQLLLATMMILRKASGPAAAAGIAIIPTAAYRWILRRRYLRAFDDVALLQTSLLDGWDTNEETSVQKREAFRQFLVDCHKAAYVPVCIASHQGTLITSEPAVVVPLDYDQEEDLDDATSVNGESVFGGSHQGGASVYSESVYGPGGSVVGGGSTAGKGGAIPDRNRLYQPYQPMEQPGRMMRRTSGVSILPPKTRHMNLVLDQLRAHAEAKGDYSFSQSSPQTSPRHPQRKMEATSPQHGQLRRPIAGGFYQSNSPPSSKSVRPSLPATPEM